MVGTRRHVRAGGRRGPAGAGDVASDRCSGCSTGCELLALPTLPIFPPRLDELGPDTLLPTVIEITRHVAAFNAAGTPCTAQPVPVAGGALPASLQLVGPLGGEEILLPTAQLVEAAVAA